MKSIDFMFILNSILFGVGLAMDAFSVSLANGLNEPGMKARRMCLIAGTFGVFQTLMPLLGWFFVRTAEQLFSVLQRFIPWIALLLLLYIGGKMLLEGIRNIRKKKTGEKDSEEMEKAAVLGFSGLLLQGIATSIDALSVGFTISEYSVSKAFPEALIIGVVTFGICIAGIRIGRRAGVFLADKASIFGGCILIFIGLEIFIKSFL